MEQASILPARARVLSGSGLKLLAMLAMLIDHSAMNFQSLLGQPLFTAFGLRITTYVLLRGIGRIAFPIFCFLLGEGFRHTRSKTRYALNLLIFALISEIPYNIVHQGTLAYARQNVFFTLLLGFLGIWAASRFRDMPLRSALILVALGICSVYLDADYGWKGYLLILLLYLLAEQPVVQAFSGVTLLGWPVGVAFAFPLINLYNGKRGFVNGPAAKYAFYLFYPVHLTLLWLIRKYTIGY